MKSRPGSSAKEIKAFCLGELFRPGKPWQLPRLETRAKRTSRCIGIRADVNREPWMAFNLQEGYLLFAPGAFQCPLMS
ncbi:MAG TPA: hypothetical protein P5307_28665, partial [Pirellulaceae bacterium]|nr:hypothetical protein [Pirellulaceae bacterium]